MKILEINRWLAPGGGERFVVDLSNELTKINGNEVHVCTYIDDDLDRASFYRKELNEKIHYTNLKGKMGPLNQMLNLIKVFRFILKIRPDVVHCHLSAFYMCVLPCLLLRKIKFVNTLHNVAEKNIKPGGEKIIKGFMYRHGMLAITISPLCYRSFTEYMKFNNTIMIDNGCREIVRTNEFKKVSKEICAYKKTANTKVFVNVARFHPQKNHLLLVNTFNAFVEKGYDAILLIIGDGDEKIKEIVGKTIKNDRIYLLGQKNNVPDYLFNSDAFCLSSKWEGAPISLLEAGFAGCYPIATPAGGCVDDIPSNDWGYLSKDFSETEFLKGLEYFMSNKIPSREKISSLYKSKFSMSACAQKYMEIFK